MIGDIANHRLLKAHVSEILVQRTATYHTLLVNVNPVVTGTDIGLYGDLRRCNQRLDI